MKRTDARARLRASLILQVQARQITATQAASQLGVSRKTYYQWEKRALEGMLQNLSQQKPGRPARPFDPQKAALEKQLRQARKELHAARQVKKLRDILDRLKATPAKKNSRARRVPPPKPVRDDPLPSLPAPAL
jgi:transposase